MHTGAPARCADLSFESQRGLKELIKRMCVREAEHVLEEGRERMEQTPLPLEQGRVFASRVRPSELA